MTTKTISTTVSGYDVSSPVTTLSITSTGYVEGNGVYTLGSGFYTIVNDGRINGAIDGVDLTLGSGASVTNGSDAYTSASIGGTNYGVRLFGSATVNNFGSITNRNSTSSTPAAVYLGNGGSVTNGSSSDTGALIKGVDGLWLSSGAGVVTNYGRMTATGGGASPGVYLGDGGALTNGGAGDTGASIRGAIAVKISGGSGAVTNFGAITSTAGQPGVSLTDGGSVTNGAAGNSSALIFGQWGVVLDLLGTVANYGTVQGSTNEAVWLMAGGSIINGSSGDRTALMSSPQGLFSPLLASIANFGTVAASAGDAINLGAGGQVTNGTVVDPSALIDGQSVGINMSAAGTVANYGAITGETAEAIRLADGGVVTNGTSGDTSALIESDVNVIGIYGATGTVANFATIRGEGNPWSGIYLQDGGSVTNGAAGDTGALVSGAYGVFLSAIGTVANFGAIQASVGQAVWLGAGGKVTNGTNGDTSALIDGDKNGVAVFAAAGAIANFGTIAGAIDHYPAVFLGDGGSVTNGSPIDPAALISGALGVELKSGGTLANFGTVRGVYRDCVLVYGSSVVTNGSNVDAGALLEGYSGVTEDAGSVSIANFGTVEGIGVAGWAGIILRGAASLTNGSLTDTRALVEGYSGVTSTVSAEITNFGTIEGVGLSGQAGVSTAGGSVTNGSAKDAKALIEGYAGILASAAATVTNFGTIEGVGGVAVTFSKPGELAVEAGSSFVGSANGDGGILDLASGAGTIALAGSVLTVSGSMAATAFSDFATVRIANGASFKVSGDNTGVLSVIGGTLTSDGTVSGTGHIAIDGGIADFGAGFEEAVYFTATTGELKLGGSKTYTGHITGFSKTGTTSLDLLDIAFAGTTTAHYSGTATSGVLTVTEGANTAKITLEGDYLSSTFTLSAAPGGGTLVVDPPKAPAPAAPHLIGPTPPHQFIAAMAGFAARGAGAVALAGALWRPPPPTLAMPRALV